MKNQMIKGKLNSSVRELIPCLKNEKEWISHAHICDFQILGYPTKKRNQMCKKYLKTIGKKKDKLMDCCDECKHLKFVVCMPNDQYDVVGIISPIFNEQESVENESC